MDADCFDRLTRFVAILRSRRGLFSLFAGAPLAGALTTLLPDAAEARRGHRRKAHRADRDRVGPEKKKKGKKKKCKPKPLATICGDRCGPVKNNCKKTVNCGSCACSPTCTTCQRCNEITRACEPDPDRVGQDCGITGQFCQEGGVCACTAATCANPTPICSGGSCVACSSHGDCGANDLCLDDGSCQPCTVTCPEGTCSGDALRTALTAGGTIYACPGKYTGRFNIASNTTLVGAGDGESEASNTILDGQNSVRVMVTSAASTTLSHLRLANGRESSFGAGIYHLGNALTLTDCTIDGNFSSVQGAGIFNQGTSIRLTRCTVTGNESANSGGGIYNINTLNLTNCQVTGNIAGETGAGIYGAAGAVTLDACTVTDNRSRTAAGGLMRNGGTMTLLNGTTVTGNTPTNCFGSVAGCTG